jgi:phage-related minor tail protein
VAETIRGINVVIGADTTRLSKALSDVNQKSRDIQSELRQVERLLKFDPSNTELLAQKQQLLSQAVVNTSEKLERLKSVQQQVTDQFERGEISEGQYRAFQREIAKTEQELQRFQERLHETSGVIEKQASSWSKLQDKLNDVGQRLQDVGSRMQSIGQEIAASFGAVSLAIGGALGFAANKSMDFEAQLSSIKAVSGATGEQMEQLKSLAIEMGSATKYSGLEAAQGIEELIKAGVSLEDIINGGLEGALSLATAGELDLAQAAEIASTALNAFKADALSVQDAANILAGAANASATSVEELQYGLSAVSAVASGVGLSFKDTTTALAVFAQNGLKGSDAGTSLKTMLLNLIPSTKEATALMSRLGLLTMNTQSALKFLAENGIKVAGNTWEDAAKGLYQYIEQEYGLKPATEEAIKTFNELIEQQGFVQSAFYDAEGRIKSLSEIAGILREKLSGMNDAQRQMALQTMFGTDAIRAANILYKEGAKGVEQMWAAMSKVTAVEVANEKMDNLKGRIEELKGAFETAQITIGNALAPAIELIVKGLQKAVDWFNSLSPSMQQFIAIGAAVAAVLTGIVAAIGVVLAVIGSAATGVGVLAEAFAGVGAKISVSFAPVTGVILGIVALAGLLYAAWKTNFGGFRDFTVQVWDLVVQKFNEAKNFIMPLITELVSYITERWKAIEPVVSVVMDAIGKIVGFILPFIYETIKFYLEQALNVFQGVFNLIAGVIKFFVALFTGDWSDMWEAIEQALSGAVEAIWGLFNLWFVGKIAGIIGSFISKGIGFFSTFVNDGIRWFTKFVSDVFSKISGWVSNMVSKISSGMAEFGGTIGRWLTNIIKDFGNFVLEIPKKIGSVVSEMVSKGKDIVRGIWEGIKSMGKWLADKVKEWALDVLPGPIAKALGIQSPSRVMRDEIGKWIPLGLAEGIERNIGAVISAINRMVQATIPSLSTPTVPNIDANVSKVADTPTAFSARPAVIQIITPDRRTLARWLVDDITEFQEFNLLRERRF